MLTALITFDLTEANDWDYTTFTRILIQRGWVPQQYILHAWKCRKFCKGRYAALREIEQDLQYAKFRCTISRVDYAVQIAEEDIHYSFQ